MPKRKSKDPGIIEDSPSAKKQPAPFDPFNLDVICAATWWDLGRLSAHRDDISWIAKQVPNWVKDSRPEFVHHITPEGVQRFASTIYDLLRRKSSGEPIATDVEKLLSPAYRAPDTFSDKLFADDEEYLQLNEPASMFWAIEYDSVFRDLQRSGQAGEDDWLSVVSNCPQCGEFFIKQRKDQVFDTTRCRTKFANRYVPRSRRQSRRH